MEIGTFNGGPVPMIPATMGMPTKDRHKKDGNKNSQPRFQAFEELATLAAETGKQCGGWQQKLLSTAQKVGGISAAGQKSAPLVQDRPESLSARAALSNQAIKGQGNKND